MKNASFNSSDVRKKCETKLKISFRSGKELNGWYYHEGKKTARITVPKGKKQLRPKTYKSMARQLLLSIDQFDDLLECPFGLSDYKSYLRLRVQPNG